MEKVLKLYNYVDGVNDSPFPNKEDQIIIGDFRSDYKRMGAAPTISCSVHHRLCLDDLWSYNVYALFNGEKFFIKQIPSSSFDNTDARYKHDLELVSERIILDNVYFYDVVSEDYEEDKPISNSSNMVFFGDIHEFAQRLNYSLNYSKLNYSVVVDEGVSSESKLLSFQDQLFSNVLQEIYNTYEIPYYFVGNTIHIGYANNTINHVFKYGVDDSLLSIQKQNANKKIINRITGVGSPDNIPYYYPNFDSKGETRVLYNNSTNNISIVDYNKYKKIKLNDKIIYQEFEEEDYSFLPTIEYLGIEFQRINDIKNTWEIKFPCTFEVPRTRDVVFSISTTYENTDEITMELYRPNGDVIGLVKDGSVYTMMPSGVYTAIVSWKITSISPITLIEAEDLVRESINIYFTSIGISEFAWLLNNKITNLLDFGIGINTTPKVGDEITIEQLSYIKPSTNLMPSIYRDSLAKERFYNAVNNAYTNPETDEYYTFNNPYIVGKPKEYIYNLEDIKPTIKGIINADGLRIDMFSEFAFDENDNDEFDEEGNYLHPYFFGKLRKFDGEFGFNLFDHSIDENEMVISMTSGSCGACEFIIGVDDESQKNIVQVDDNGNLLRDSNGDVIRSGNPQERQNDTRNNEVWVALKKDKDTFGVLMPNAQSSYRPQAGDTFVILHIDLPKSYILAAEKRLEQSLIKYMSENNDEKFAFSISFSRIFFAENPNILAELNENAIIAIEYDDKEYKLNISSFSCNITSDQLLPEIRVELKDELTIPQNTLTNAVKTLKTDVTNNINNVELQVTGYTTNVKKDLTTKVNSAKQELSKTINNVEEYSFDTRTLVLKSIQSIDKNKVNADDVYDKQTIDNSFVSKINKQDVYGEKDFKDGLKVNGGIIEYNEVDKYWKLQGNLIITGAITMYAQDGSINIPTIAEGLPFDNKTIWFNPTTGQIEVIGGTGGGEGVSNFWDLNNIPSWITNTKPTYSYSDIQGTPDLSKYALASDIPSLSGYATQTWVESKGFALNSDLTILSTKLNDFLEGSDTDNIINKWKELETFLSGLSQSDNLATILGNKAEKTDLAKYIPIAGATEILGEKNFVGGLKVNGSPIYYDKDKKYWKLEGDLLVTGGVSMYASDTEFTPSTIMDAIVVDNVTIIKQDGKLVALGGGGTGGGIADSVAWGNVLGKPEWITDNVPSITISGTAVSLGGSITQSALRTALGLGSNAYSSTEYLPLTGGILTGALHINTDNPNCLYLQNTQATSTSKYAAIRFVVGGTHIAGIGVNTSNGFLQRINSDFSGSYTVWDSGNDGSGSGLDADLLDGKQPSELNVGSADYLSYTYSNKSINFARNESKVRLISNTESNSVENGAAARYTSGLSVITNYVGWQLVAYGSHSVNPYYRSVGDDGVWGSWKQLAYLTDNVASATKLQTARTIWGQSFDGTGNVDGNLYLTNRSSILSYDTNNATVDLLMMYYNDIHLASGANSKGYDTYINGNTIKFRYGSSSSLGLVLNSSGNITIGSSDFASTSAKLFVDGVTKISNDLFFTVNNAGIGFKDSGGTNRYNLILSTDNVFRVGGGNASAGYNTYVLGKQVQLRYGTSHTLGFILNESGNVTIGSSDLASTDCKLYVNGVVRLGSNIIMNNSAGFYIKDTTGANKNAMFVSNSNNFHLGYNLAISGYNTYLDGNNIIFRYGTNVYEGMVLKSNGNVGIGTANPDQKLYVAGRIKTLTSDVDGLIVKRHQSTGIASVRYLPNNQEVQGWRVGASSEYKMSFEYSSDSFSSTTTNMTLSNAGLLTLNGVMRVQRRSNTSSYLDITSDDIFVKYNGYDSDGYCGHIFYSNGVELFRIAGNTKVATFQGNVLTTGGVTMYSARKLKDIQDERGLSLEELRTIKPTRFTWKDGRDNKVHIGGIADDVVKVLPEVIYKTGEDDTLTMDYGNAAFAISASLIKPVVNHEERIKMLEEENKRLKEQIERLKLN